MPRVPPHRRAPKPHYCSICHQAGRWSDMINNSSLTPALFKSIPFNICFQCSSYGRLMRMGAASSTDRTTDNTKSDEKMQIEASLFLAKRYGIISSNEENNDTEIGTKSKNDSNKEDNNNEKYNANNSISCSSSINSPSFSDNLGKSLQKDKSDQPSSDPSKMKKLKQKEPTKKCIDLVSSTNIGRQTATMEPMQDDSGGSSSSSRNCNNSNSDNCNSNSNNRNNSNSDNNNCVSNINNSNRSNRNINNSNSDNNNNCVSNSNNSNRSNRNINNSNSDNNNCDSNSSIDNSDLNRRETIAKGRVKFSDEENRNVVKGAEKFGVGKWSKILAEYDFHPCRTSVSIKDKYRTLLKQGVISN